MSLDGIRSNAANNLARLPEPLRALDPNFHYPVAVAQAIIDLAAVVDRRLAHAHGADATEA